MMKRRAAWRDMGFVDGFAIYYATRPRSGRRRMPRLLITKCHGRMISAFSPRMP